MEVIFENNDILVLNKEAGVESVASQNKGRSITELIQMARETKTIKPVHRLDRDTSGVMVFAKTDKSLKRLEDLFKERKTTKEYLAICVGIPRNPEGSIRRNLSKWMGGHKAVKVVKGGGGLSAETDYKLLTANKEFGLSLIEFTPHQGRTHQIRVHAEAFGRPVLCDHQYGNREVNNKVKAITGLNRHALHAWTLVLPEFAENGEDLTLVAPIPEDFSITCDKFFTDWHEAIR